jgi:uncharacterized delta-60 repeat protein
VQHRPDPQTADSWISAWLCSGDRGCKLGSVTARRSAAALVVGAVLLFPALLSAARGDLDPTFGSGGKVTTDLGGSEVGWAVAVQRDGKVVVVGGRSDPDPPDDFLLVRYTASGHLDRSFDGDGMVETDFGGRLDWASDVEVQADGKIVVAGRSLFGLQGQGGDIALARYNRDGSVDLTFGESGRVLTAFPGGVAGASAVKLTADGKIVVGGSTGGGLASDFALARYLPDGALDASFGSGGRVVTPISSDTDWLLELAAQPDGKLVAAGYSYRSLSQGHIALARYHPNGSLDSSFGRDGSMVASFLPFGMVGEHVLVQRDGKLLVAGIGGVARFTVDGSIDRSFGEGGRARSGDVQPWAAALQPDGKILVIGTVSSGPTGDFGVARLTADGRLDRTYGRNGSIRTGFSARSDDQALDAVLRPDGKLVVSGMSNPRPVTGTWGPWDFAVARYATVRFCVVPNVRRKALSAARASLTKALCKVGTVKRTYSVSVKTGRVISQRPAPRTRLAELAKVNLVVSRGRRR